MPQQELKGTVHAKFVEQQITDNYRKQELVVTTDEETNYPQQILCHAANGKIDLLKGIEMGMKVKVFCNLKGKENKGKYYNSLEIWKIDKI